MSTNKFDFRLLESEEKHQQMARLVVLKLAASWLEKQYWVSPPYGGQNPIQDLLFQIQLTTNRTWHDLFSNDEKNFNFDVRQLKDKIFEMGNLDSELKDFFNKTLVFNRT